MNREQQVKIAVELARTTPHAFVEIFRLVEDVSESVDDCNVETAVRSIINGASIFGTSLPYMRNVFRPPADPPVIPWYSLFSWLFADLWAAMKKVWRFVTFQDREEDEKS